MSTKMSRVPVQEKHYGRDVWVNSTTDTLRQQECLCHNCALYHPHCDNNCLIAADLEEACAINGIARLVTRCPDWEER